MKYIENPFGMKQLIFILFTLFCIHQHVAQEFSAVDEKISSYPTRYESPEKLAKQIESDFATDLEKVRAVYYWLSTNVAYDMDEFRRGSRLQQFQYSTEEEKQEKLNQLNDRIISTTLIANKAVCEGYAQTFHKICSLLQIESQVIPGFSKTDFRDIALERAIGDHAWNAVKIDGEWKLLDATWSAGATQGANWVKRFNDFFFLTDPTVFGLTHHPYEKKWQLVDTPQSQEAFFNMPLFSPYFFDYGMKLVSPLAGKLVVKTNDKITFTLENVPKELRLFYAYNGDTYSQEIKRVYTGNTCTFEVPFPRENTAVLYILALRNVILTYRINLPS